jgi:hypothetical protein
MKDMTALSSSQEGMTSESNEKNKREMSFWQGERVPTKIYLNWAKSHQWRSIDGIHDTHAEWIPHDMAIH